jgi:hypothetical protein
MPIVSASKMRVEVCFATHLVVVEVRVLHDVVAGERLEFGRLFVGLRCMNLA